MNGHVYKWTEIEDDFNHGLILGNGASIAFDPRFNYHSLKDRAEELRLITPNVQRVFEHLRTTDFELVMRMLWHASKINQALEISDDCTTRAYESVRDALIEVVRAVHPPYEEIFDHLLTAATFMSRFSTVVSLNYDVLVYWAILVGNQHAPNRFKDCFIESEFQQDWQWLREPYGSNPETTLIFYPHGNLSLGANLEGAEFKIQAETEASLLDTVFDKWRTGDATPVFVSEGTSEQKRMAIRHSPYLSTVYKEVLPNLGESVVVYGWSIGDNDDHLLDAICRRRCVHRFAVAVNPTADNLGEFKARVHRKLSARLGRDSFDLTFFDRGSERCWNIPCIV